MKKLERHMTVIAARAARGFSLIELMISIAIGLMIIAGLVGVVTSNTRNSQTNERTAELQENGRYAMTHLQTQLRHADFRGYTWVVPNTSTVSVTNECLAGEAGAGTFVNKISQGVWGANDSNPFAANCLASGYVRGDVLVVRRVATAALTAGTLVANNLYFRSTFTKGEMFQASAGQLATADAPQNVDGTPFGDPLADFLVQQYVYYIGQGDCDGGGDVNQNALCRLALQGNAFVKELVVNGIEQLQVQYGRTPFGTSTTQFYDADQITTDADWEDVSSVRISLLSVNSRAESGYSNDTNYSLGDWNNTFNDSFRRQVFSTTVQVRNFHD